MRNRRRRTATRLSISARSQRSMSTIPTRQVKALQSDIVATASAMLTRPSHTRPTACAPKTAPPAEMDCAIRILERATPHVLPIAMRQRPQSTRPRQRQRQHQPDIVVTALAQTAKNIHLCATQTAGRSTSCPQTRSATTPSSHPSPST